ncbi:MAG: hypothetical protein JNL58_17505 [Planctomyces sp.]|nr:hypothetical protein [Planctomyces sp.]
MTRFAILCLIVLAVNTSNADEWGSISGQIVVDGEIPPRELLFAKGSNVKDAEVCATDDYFADDLLIDEASKGLSNVFVYLRKSPSNIHPDLKSAPEESVKFESQKCRFVPHCLVCRRGQVIEFSSSDSVHHNPHPLSLANPASGLIVPPNKTPLVFKYARAETLPIKVVCDYHPWMKAYWLVLDHPYAAITDREGRFQIENLPVGRHEFSIWHERTGYIEKACEVIVTAAESEPLVPVVVSSKRLSKAAIPPTGDQLP